jgi:SAM-dependent methyltransferase
VPSVIEFADADVGAGLTHARFALDGDPDPAQLSWRRGHSDWFFRHFDHAGPTIGSYFFKDSELLRGRVLDVGCGDGITDLALYLRYQPEQLVGVDPFRGYERLASVASAQGIPMDPWPAGLQFSDADANFLPFADDSFDVVISWGSLEHIAGGYLQALREIKRVLRPDGLFFVHPGLYYSNFGHHLGEFSDEPFFHLKQSRESLHEFVMNTPPRRMDRAGHVASNAEYWQWYTELNPITVIDFEQVLRAYDFEPWRVAIRTEPIIEYTPEILHYPMQDLATAELYVSCWNRKRPRPASA